MHNTRPVFLIIFSENLRITTELITRNQPTSEKEIEREKESDCFTKKGGNKSSARKRHACPFEQLSLLSVTVQSLAINRHRLTDNPVLYSSLQ